MWRFLFLMVVLTGPAAADPALIGAARTQVGVTSLYDPANWGLATTDRNIDHRRVPNLQTLLTRIGADLPVTSDPAAFASGDIVTWMLPGNLPHIGILSDRMSDADTHPIVLHNIGAGAAEEDRLFDFPITGHYRITPAVRGRLPALGG